MNYQAIKAPYFIDDDTDILVGVNDINLSLKKFYLPLGYVHGPFTLYITKLSGLVFGENYFGWRVIQYLSTILIIFITYKTALEIFGKRVAFFSLVLAASNLFFIFNSKYIGEEIHFLLFNSAAIFFFSMLLKKKQQKYLVLSSIMIGLGLLTKATTLWLLSSFIIFMLLHKKDFYFIKKETRFMSIFFIVVLVYPYLYWLVYSGNSIIRPYINDLFKVHMRLNVPQLFIGYFMMPTKHVDYNLGYNILGPIQGLIGFCGILYCFNKGKEYHIDLLNKIFFIMLIISLFVFSGQSTEPRHFSTLIVISIFAGSILLSRIWAKGIVYKILIVITIFAILIEAVKFVNKLESYYYPLHSRLRLSSWGMDMDKEEVDLNDISKKFIGLCYHFKPTLIVFPSNGLDSTAHFVTAYTGIKTMSPLIIDKHLHYNINDLQRIVVFLTPEDNADKYINWAKALKYSYHLEEYFLDIYKHKLPVRIIWIHGDIDKVSEYDIIVLKSITYM